VGRGEIAGPTQERRPCRNRRREWPAGDNWVVGGHGGLPRRSAVLQRGHSTDPLKATSGEEWPEFGGGQYAHRSQRIMLPKGTARGNSRHQMVVSW